MMFSSLSACTPNTLVQTEYQAEYSHKLVIDSAVTIKVNGSVVTDRPVDITVGSLVVAEVTTPVNYLGYAFYSYRIDDRDLAFAVVNRNNYVPTIRTDNIKKKWYNYPNFAPLISFYSPEPDDPFYLAGFGRGLIDVDSLHVILDLFNEDVHFYSVYQESICRVTLPAGPIEYRKVVSTTPQGTYSQDLLVLCSDFKIYRIKFDRRYYVSDEFRPAAVPFFPLDDLPFQEDIPAAGSFMDQARKRFLRNLFPVVTALDYNGTEIYLAGKDVVYILTNTFVLLRQIAVPGEEIACLSCFSVGAVLTTKAQRVLYVSATGVVPFFQGVALGTPTAINNFTRVVVPDSNNQRLLVFYNVGGSYTVWSTPEFIPAYAREFDGRLWVTGHDSIDALGYLADDSYTKYRFKRKVTLVSSVGNSLVGIHHIRNTTVLDLTGIQKVVPFDVEPRTGPLTHIGTAPVQITMLGQEGVLPVAGPGLTVWTNGIANEPANTGDYIGVSYRAVGFGQYRSAFIIGETAFDYDVTVSSSQRLEDHFLAANIADYRVTTANVVYFTPNVGNIDSGWTTNIAIGFDWRSTGNVYSNISVGTNGSIIFGSNVPSQANVGFGNIAADAVYAVNRDLYQGLPVRNVDPVNIGLGILDSGETPGVYVEYQDFDEFRGVRVKWVGTSMASYPLGNTQASTVTLTSYPEIPVPSFANVFVDDYVSGSTITSSTRVTGLEYFNITNQVYKTQGNVLYLNSGLASGTGLLITNLIRKYANAYVGSNFIGIVQNQTVTKYDLGLIGRIGNTVYVDGVINPQITTDWEFGFFSPVVNVYGNTEERLVQLRTDCANISLVTDSFTVLKYYPTIKQAIVDSTDYTRLFILQQSLIGIGGTLTQKFIQTRRLDASITIGSAVLGNVITIALTTQNVPDNYRISYDLTGTSSDTFIGSPATSGNLVVNMNTAGLTLQTNANSTSIGTTTFTIAFGNISDLYLSTSSVSFTVNTASPITSTVSVQEYRLQFSGTTTSVPDNTVVNTQYTAIDFPTNLGVTSSKVFAQLNTVELDSAATTGSYKFEGRYVKVTPNVSVSSGVPLLFKHNRPHPAFTYEVGLYSGLNFQYAEIFLSSNNHASTGNIGISNYNRSETATITSQAQRSFVFGSPAQNGAWRTLGLGSFSKNNQGFVPRSIRFLQAPSFEDTRLRYEFYLEQLIPAASNVALALSYGTLTVNNGRYTGVANAAVTGSVWSVDRDDFIVIDIPFNNSQQPIAPVFSVGTYQVGLPAVPERNYGSYIQTTYLTENQPQDVYRTGSVTIGATGRYVIPEYYRSGFGYTSRNITFRRTRGATTTTLTGIYHEFIVGDVVTAEYVKTSQRRYDLRDVVLVGPITYRLAWRTSGDPVLNSFQYPALIEPFVRDRQYGPDDLSYDGWAAHDSGNTQLAATTATTTGLWINDSNVKIIVNGAVKSNYVTSVSTGANVELRWDVQTYFESNLTVFQVMKDTDNGNIFVPVGVWPIQNRTILGADRVQAATDLELAAVSSVAVPGQYFDLDPIDSDFYPGQTIILPDEILPDPQEPQTEIDVAVTMQYWANNLDMITGNIGTATEQMHPVYIDEIVKEFVQQPTTFRGDVSQADYVEQATQFLSDVTSDFVKQPSQIQVDPITSDFVKPNYFYFGDVSESADVYLTSFMTWGDIVFRYSAAPTPVAQNPVSGALLTAPQMLYYQKIFTRSFSTTQSFRITTLAKYVMPENYFQFERQSKIAEVQDSRFVNPGALDSRSLGTTFSSQFGIYSQRDQRFSNVTKLLPWQTYINIDKQFLVIGKNHRTFDWYRDTLKQGTWQQYARVTDIIPWGDFRDNAREAGIALAANFFLANNDTVITGYQDIKFASNHDIILPPIYSYQDNEPNIIVINTSLVDTEETYQPGMSYTYANNLARKLDVNLTLSAAYLGNLGLASNQVRNRHLANTFSPSVFNTITASPDFLTVNEFRNNLVFIVGPRINDTEVAVSFKFELPKIFNTVEVSYTHWYNLLNYYSMEANVLVRESNIEFAMPAETIHSNDTYLPSQAVRTTELPAIVFASDLELVHDQSLYFDVVPEYFTSQDIYFDGQPELIVENIVPGDYYEPYLEDYRIMTGPGYGPVLFEMKYLIGDLDPEFVQPTIIYNPENSFELVPSKYNLVKVDYEKLASGSSISLPPYEPFMYREVQFEFSIPPELDHEPMFVSANITQSGAFYSHVDFYHYHSTGRFVYYEKEYEFAPGGFSSLAAAQTQADKYVSAVPFRIPGTAFYNYRILFNTHIHAVPARPDSYFQPSANAVPQYGVWASRAESVESESITFNVDTRDVPDGTQIRYNFTEISASDVPPGTPLSGNVTIAGGQASVTITMIDDGGTNASGYEFITFNLTDLGKSVRVKVYDPRSTPVPSVPTARPVLPYTYGDPMPLPEFFSDRGEELKYEHPDPTNKNTQWRTNMTPAGTPRYTIARRHRWPVMWYIRGG